jgi:hypothetical protein
MKSFYYNDRIDSNATRKDPLHFYLMEKTNKLFEYITGCDFNVNIDWQDNRGEIR